MSSAAPPKIAGASAPVSTIDRIRRAGPTLSRAELRVAEAILSDIDVASRLSTRELARLARVSEPTVVRFARRVECNGFTHLKRCLSQDFATARMFVLSEPPIISRDAEVVASQVYEATAQALACSFQQRAPAALFAAAEMVVAARRVFCMGTGGSSANLAQEAENRLFRFDIHAAALVDEYKQRLAASICTARDVLLIFSVTGQPRALGDCARLAAAAGANVIAVTRPGSALAEASNVVLPLQIPDNDRNFAIPNRSRYGQLYILDCLATMVASRRVRRSEPKLRRARAALLEVHGPTEHQPIGD